MIEEIPLSDSRADEIMDPEQKAQLLDEIELLDGASADFDQELVDVYKRQALRWMCCVTIIMRITICLCR